MNSLPGNRFFDRTTPPHIATLILLASVAPLSMTVFLPSLPNMTDHFRTEYRYMQLSVAAFLFLNGLLHIVIGPLSDRYGRRPVVLLSVVVFMGATVGCMVATTVETFLAFRMLQAVIVTGIVLSRAIVRDMVPQNEAASMIGYVTMGMALVPMIAPTIGGTLDVIYGWQASFGLMLVFGALLLVFVHFDLGETAVNRSSSFAQQFREYPELFRSRRFWGYAAISGCASGSFFAYLGGAPIIGSEFFGLSPSELGLYFGMTAFGYMVGNFLSGRFSVRTGTDRMVLIGALLMIPCPTGAAIAVALDFSHPVGFFGFTTIIGIGNGIILPNATAGMLSVRPHLAGTASGIGGAITIGGGAGVSAFAGLILSDNPNPVPLIAIFAACILLSLLAAGFVQWVEFRIRMLHRAAGQVGLDG